MELLKHVTDKIIIWFLKSTSSFGAELTSAGHEEQKAWREQRLRNLKGLSMRSKERRGAEAKPAQAS
jgi:hypothetical protein